MSLSGMRKLAHLLLAVGAVAALQAQTPCKRNGSAALCLGDKKVDVFVNGNLYLSSPDGGSLSITPGAMTNPLTTTATGAASSTGTSAPAVLDAGSVWVRGGAQVVGTLNAQQLLTAAVIDAGAILVRGDEQVVGVLTVGGATALAALDAGATYFRGDVQIGSNLISGSPTFAGGCTLNAGSPATCTATVRSGAACVCSINGTSAASAAKGAACSVSSTTLTITSANAANEVAKYVCF